MSVPAKYGKRGIGKLLVSTVEDQLVDIAKREFATFQEKCTNGTPQLMVSMEMGVINQRKDLFPWYESQGYVVMGEIRPNDEELLRICLDGVDICCILMRKTLLQA